MSSRVAVLALMLSVFIGPVVPPARLDAADPDPIARAVTVLYDDIQTETLPNGLRIYLKPIPGAATVSTMMAYKVGSADEELDQTGLSHYLEHLMFKGTDRLLPGDIDRLTQRNGGRNNAYTSEDMTVYHFDFAADRWEVALTIEADRMRNLRIDEKHEFEQEKGAVIAELDGNEDEPWELEFKAILPLLFGPDAPYGHPVIGERAHVRAATAPIIKAHYDKWYHPNNAALVIVGGFDPKAAMARITELFGPIPAGKLPERKPTVPPPASGKQVRKEIPSKFEAARLLVGFPTVRIGEPDFYPLEVIEAVLSSGKTSRLYTTLIDGAEVAGEIGADNSAGRYPGWFSVQVGLLDSQDRAKAEKFLWAELKKLTEEPISEAELKRVRRNLAAGLIFDREDPHALADSIAQAVTTNDLEYLKSYLGRVTAVTAADVQRVARKYLVPEKAVVVWSLPTAEANARTHRGATPLGGRRSARNAPAAGGAVGRTLTDTQRVVLPNGLTLLLYPDRRLPIVVAQALVKDVRLREPANRVGVATLVGNLLDEGTATATAEEIARRIEDVGGVLAFSDTGGSVQVLSSDRELGLKLFFECLTTPTFPEDAFRRAKTRQLSEVEDDASQPQIRAAWAFNEQVYGHHPLGRPAIGRIETVEKLSRADCTAFHKQVFVPNNTLIAVAGDIDPKAVAAEIEQLTAAWKPAELPRLDLPDPPRPERFMQKVLSVESAQQLHMYLGHLGVKRSNPDYYTLLVMDNVLGTGPGFTDRLSANLRDRQGLAYTVTATIAASAAEQPGTFSCYVGTYPDKFAVVKDGVLKEVRRIRDEPPTAAEVDDAKKYLLGSLPFRLTTLAQVNGQLLSAERFGLGLGFFDDYRKAVTAVTPAMVQAAARKYLDPDRMVLVAAGPVDETGKPLKADE